MGFQLQTKDFIRYFQEAREVIAAPVSYTHLVVRLVCLAVRE